MIISHISFKLVPDTITLLTKEEIITVLAHMTILVYLFSAAKTLDFTSNWFSAWIKYCLHRVIRVMPFVLSIRTGKETFLT